MITLDALRPLLAELLGHPMPPLTRETPFRDLPGWDSVAHLAMLLGLERRLGIAFSAKQLTSLFTVGDLLDALS